MHPQHVDRVGVDAIGRPLDQSVSFDARCERSRVLTRYLRQFTDSRDKFAGVIPTAMPCAARDLADVARPLTVSLI